MTKLPQTLIYKDVALSLNKREHFCSFLSSFNRWLTELRKQWSNSYHLRLEGYWMCIYSKRTVRGYYGWFYGTNADDRNVVWLQYILRILRVTRCLLSSDWCVWSRNLRISRFTSMTNKHLSLCGWLNWSALDLDSPMKKRLYLWTDYYNMILYPPSLHFLPIETWLII